ncbi:MAG: DUF5320 domain-containing protein [Candidatus Aureabacteria bacterium]|nr:DUF5320 domain-containing protein [Candidatus Auribacterota bacterium]
MPGGDRTGPNGLGAMSGRAAGFCAGYAMPGYMNPIPGRGYFGRGRGFFGYGRGRGRQNWYNQAGFLNWQNMPLSPLAYGKGYPYASELSQEQETDLLKNEAELLKKQLDDIQNRIKSIEKAEEDKKA